MYFGSVKFFRHLILTVVFGWIAVATILAVYFGIRCHKLENEEKTPLTIEDHIAQMTAEGFTVEEINAFLNRGADAAGGSVIAHADRNDIPADTVPEVSETVAVTTEATSVQSAEAVTEQTVITEAYTEQAAAETSAPEVQTVTEPVQQAQTEAPVPAETAPVTEAEPAAPSSSQESYSDMYASKPSTRIKPASGTVLLTFEGAPSGNMSDILIILKRQNVKAAFMLSGCGYGDDRDIVREARDIGCTFGVLAGENKTYSSSADYLADFSSVYNDIKDTCGSGPSLYRIPDSTEMSDQVRKEVTAELDRRGFTYCSYNTISDDRVTGMEWQELYDTVTSRIFLNHMAGKASVVQLHGGSSDQLTVLTTEDIILGLKADGYTFAAYSNTTLSE